MNKEYEENTKMYIARIEALEKEIKKLKLR
jgi:uncharacterized protein (UPF0335 family)